MGETVEQQTTMNWDGLQDVLQDVCVNICKANGGKEGCLCVLCGAGARQG